ncbi:MAG: hypothetical protein J7M34_01060, partial [Anaerolineae bacterium]|nr:hypothetical protein [Anaerolineae bacterium]
VLVREEPRALAVAVSSSGARVLMGTAGRGLWLSEDGGRRWRQVPEFQDAYVATLVVDRAAGGRAYASTSDRMYYSEDGGRTWNRVSGLAGRAYCFAFGLDGALYAGLKGGVARSTDGGRMWAQASQGFPLDVLVFSLAVGKSSRGGYTLYAATRDGVYRSVDWGETWHRAVRGPGWVDVTALAGDEDGGIVAVTPLGLYRRAIGEEAWVPVAQQLKHRSYYAVSEDATTHVLYAGTEKGLARSRDGGRTWEDVSPTPTPRGIVGILTDPDDPNHLFARLAFERVYESGDGGRTWQARWDGMEVHHVVLSIARSPSGEILAGTQDGLFRWDARGKRWRREPLPDPGASVFAIASDPAGHTWYVGTTRGLWSRSGVGAWQPRAVGVIQDTVTALAVLPGGHIYVGTMYAGAYHSCDGGETWYRVPGVPADATVNAILVSANRMYFATDRGVFRGPDSACAPPEATAWDGAEQGGWARMVRELAWARRRPPVRPYPVVHMLRADDSLFQLAREIGFKGVVQVFSWQEIEPTAGEWFWEYPDSVVRAATFYGFDLIVRLDHPPTWALQGDRHGSLPFDEDAYLQFVRAVVRRYRGRVRGYIVWNEPNLASEWKGKPNPAAYASLLQHAYLVIKQEDPLAIVVSAGLASTNERSDEALDDHIFLDAMYRAGARLFFDALGVHPYGFAYPPEDPCGAHGGFNMSRILDLRAIMEAHGDRSKPVWATEVGWTTHGVGDHAWLTVSPEEQADYLVRAWRRARREWPWLDVFTVWNLSLGNPDEDEKIGYSLLDEEGSPKPACQALRDLFRSQVTVDPWRLWEAFWPDPSPRVALAQDVEIHLGDNE